MEPLPSFDFDVTKLPWPDGKQILFKDAHSNRDAAFIYPTRSWNIYADGYQNAYERLFESWDTGIMRPDNLAYPLVFLCRHYIELRLKDIMETSQQLLSLPVTWRKSHDLLLLWKIVRPLIERIWPNEPTDTLEHVQTMLNEFALRDPNGMQFRYPINNDGATHLPSIKGLDLAALRGAMSQLQNFLDGVSMGVSVYLDDVRASI